MRSLRFGLTAIMALAASSGAFSQQLHENIGVEGKFVREVIVQERINTLPTRQLFTLENSPLTFSLGSVVTGYSPSWCAMPLSTPFVSRQISKSRGYLDISTGMWLNSNLSAGYKIVENEKLQAGVWLQHNSTSLYKPKISWETENVKRFRYDEKIGAYLSRNWNGVGVLDAALDYHFGYFNYYGYSPVFYVGSNQSISPLKSIGNYDAPAQVVNEATARIAWRDDLQGAEALKYNLNFNMHYFGFRDFYAFDPSLTTSPLVDKGLRETHLQLNGSVAKPWKNGSTIGLEISANALLYSGGCSPQYSEQEYSHELGFFPYSIGLQKPDNYGTLTLTPFYRFSRGKLNIRLGADIDFAFNAGNKGDRFGAFKAAPDVKLDWRTGSLGVYLNVTGGNELQTLASLHELDYYNMPMLSTTRPVYTPLDAKLGFNFGPFSGFSAGINVAYKISNHVPLGGWYTQWLHSGFSHDIDLSSGVDDIAHDAAYCFDTKGINLRGFSLGAHLSYDYGSILKLRASATYQPQNGEKGYFNGLDRARWTADFTAEIHPIKPLGISLGYYYRGVRRIYTREAAEYFNTDGTLLSMRLPDITDLRLGASYQINPKIQVYVNAINLLGQKTLWLPSLPLEGVNVTAGVSVVF